MERGVWTSLASLFLTAISGLHLPLALSQPEVKKSSPSGQEQPLRQTDTAARIPEGLGWYEIPETKLTAECPSSTEKYDFRFYCHNVVDAWGGAIADTARNRLILWGGGHNDYYGNEIYALDLNELKMVRLTDPSPINGPAPYAPKCVTTLLDGKPNARHAYSGLAYVADMDRLYAFSGSLACGSGDGGNDTWLLDLATLEWKRMDPTGGDARPPSYLFNMIAQYDPNTRRVFLHDRKNLWMYQPDRNVYTLVRKGVESPLDANGVIDPKRRLLLIVGNGVFHAYRLRGDYEREDWSEKAKGCEALLKATVPGLAYDPVQDRVVGWAGGDSVLVFDADKKTCSEVSFPNGPGPAAELGVYGRWRYFPAVGVFALVNSAGKNAYTLRLTPPPARK